MKRDLLGKRDTLVHSHTLVHLRLSHGLFGQACGSLALDIDNTDGVDAVTLIGRCETLSVKHVPKMATAFATKYLNSSSIGFCGHTSSVTLVKS